MRQLSEGGLKSLLGLRQEDLEDKSMEIMVSKEDHVFVWDAKSSAILCLPLDNAQAAPQVFSLTDPPMFPVRRMEISVSGRWISLSGPQGVSVVCLPPRLGQRLGGGAQSLNLKTIPVAERFFLCQKKLLIQQVGWHPASEEHLLVLSSDNFLRVYDLTDTTCGEAVRSMSLRPSPLFGESHYSIKASLGETAVGFSFAPPPSKGEVTAQGGGGQEEWPLFILLGNGSLFCILFDILQEKKAHRVMGPIRTVKQDTSEEFCRILCLHPVISSPPIIVLATLGGTLLHCLILHDHEQEEEEEDALSQVSEWSAASIMNAEDSAFSMHVFESVELELGLSSKGGNQEESLEKPFSYPISLHPDPTTPGRYFCSHGAGVHCVEVPMIFHLVRMAMNPEEDIEGAGLPSLNGDCVVEHLLCTRMGPKCPPSPVLGLTVIYPQTQLLVLLSTFNVETLSLASPQIQAPIPLYAKGNASPLKKKAPLKEPFDERMKSLLQQKLSSHPLIRSAQATDLSPKESLEFLTRSTQVLREENLSRLKLVRTEIQLRSKNLQRQKETQSVQLTQLERDRKDLRDKAGVIAEKYEDLKDAGHHLISRIEVVLQNIQKRLPISSDAELSMAKELAGLNKRMKELKLSLDQVKAKDRYQLKQIQKATCVQTDTRRWRGGSKAAEMEDYQLENVKEILQQDSLQISDLVRSLNASKKKLTCF